MFAAAVKPSLTDPWTIILVLLSLLFVAGLLFAAYDLHTGYKKFWRDKDDSGKSRR